MEGALPRPTPYDRGMPAPIVRIVGPAGSGKTMLITSLQEALRAEDLRTASVVTRGPGLTAISVSNGASTTLERDVPLGYIATVVSWIDPTVDVILAEGYEETGAPAVELRPAGGPALGVPEHELLAVVDPDDIAAAFAQDGPGYTAGVAERILRHVLDREPTPDLASPEANGTPTGTPEVEREVSRLQRMFRRFRT